MSDLKSDIMKGTNISKEYEYVEFIRYLRAEVLPDMTRVNLEHYTKDLQFCVKVDPEYFFVSFCKLHQLLVENFKSYPLKNLSFRHILL